MSVAESPPIAHERDSPPADTPTARLVLALTIAISVAAGGWSRLPELAGQGFDWFALDGRRVIEASSVWLAGGDPYSVEGYLYSPWATVLAAPLALLPKPLPIALWTGATFLVAILAVILMTRGYAPWLRLLLVVVVLTFRPFVVDVYLANGTTWLVAAAILAVHHRHPAAGLLLGVLAAAVPKPLLVPIFVWGAVHRRPTFAVALVIATACTVLATLVAGPAAFVRFFQTLLAFDTVAFVGNESLSLLSLELHLVVALLATIGALIVLRTGDAVTALLWASLLGIFAAPYVGGYAALAFLCAAPFLARTKPALVPVGMIAFAIAGVVPVVAATFILIVDRLPRPRSRPAGDRH